MSLETVYSITARLDDQADLTAVERFADAHGKGCVTSSETIYRDLIPSHTPGLGQQYAFEVDLDACTGCKACVTGCHSRNGLDEGETWRSVAIVDNDRGLPQPITAACHHCLEPACLSGCPVRAYEKDPLTGIVAHLDDQCIGCRYCEMTCPYEVPQFNEKLGIVRKCDMCTQRLAEGETPACAEACPNAAIRIVTVDVAQASSSAADNFRLVPDAPNAAYSLPTTIYKSRNEPIVRPPSMASDSLQSGNREIAHPHTPLAAMLVLTQAAAGLVWAAAAGLGTSQALWLAAALALMLGMAVAPLHLGRPLYAYRALLGLRTSWLSREILAMGLFASTLFGLAGLSLFGQPIHPALVVVVVAASLLTLACSAMVYIATPRPAWARPATAIRFVATAIAVAVVASSSVLAVPILAGCLLVVGALRYFSGKPHSDTPSLLSPFSAAGHLFFLIGALVALAAANNGLGVQAGLAVAAVCVAEFADRLLFFARPWGPRMPGAARAG